MARFIRLGFVSVSLACGGCVVAPPPTPIAAPAEPATASAPQQQQNCREFQKTVTIGGQSQKAFGTTCQQPDGSWKIVSPEEASPPPAPPVAAAPAYPAYPYAYYPYPGYVYGPPVAVGLGFGWGWHW